MKVPSDAPLWAQRFVEALENEASKMLEKAKTADEALRATGAHALLRFASNELEIEVANEEQAVTSARKKLYERKPETR